MCETRYAIRQDILKKRAASIALLTIDSALLIQKVNRANNIASTINYGIQYASNKIKISKLITMPVFKMGPKNINLKIQ